MALHFEAILPKKVHNAATARKALDKLLLSFQAEAQNQLQAYPPWSPWKNPPRTGPRAGGRRTGTLGRNWGSYKLVHATSITMTNKTPYARYVQGRAGQQTRVMNSRGWVGVDKIGRAAALRAIAKWKAYEP